MDVNAKQLFSKPVNEAEEGEQPPRPGGPRGGPSRRPMPPRRHPGGPMGADDVGRMVGGEGGPEGGPEGAPKSQFNPKELSQLKDVMILVLASLLGSDLDRGIGEALISGQPLDQSQMQHIIDEARRANIPASHGPLMQKIFQQLGGS